MYYCNECHNDRKLPSSDSKTKKTCHFCGKRRMCYNVPLENMPKETVVDKLPKTLVNQIMADETETIRRKFVLMKTIDEIATPLEGGLFQVNMILDPYSLVKFAVLKTEVDDAINKLSKNNGVDLVKQFQKEMYDTMIKIMIETGYDSAMQSFENCIDILKRAGY